MANAESQALADLTAAVTDLTAAVATEITALQAAINAQGVNNSPAIETAVSNIRSLIGGLNASIPAPAPTPAPAPSPAPASPAPATPAT